MFCLKLAQAGFDLKFGKCCVAVFPAAIRRGMGGAPKPRRRLTPATCADRISEMNAEEQKMMLQMLLKRHKKDPNILQSLSAFNIEGTVAGPEITQDTSNGGATSTIVQPTTNQLYQLAFVQAMPFVGFGFLDNFIMIIAGEYIDYHIGATFAISTMAAAALGNTISDLFGIGSAWYVENLSGRLGLHAPPLTLEQLELRASRIAANSGRGIGVVVGCILGMFPLLFLKSKDDAETKDDKQKTKEV